MVKKLKIKIPKESLLVDEEYLSVTEEYQSATDSDGISPCLPKNNKWCDPEFVKTYHKNYYNNKKNTMTIQQTEYKNNNKILSLIEKIKKFNNVKFLVSYNGNVYSNPS